MSSSETCSSVLTVEGVVKTADVGAGLGPAFMRSPMPYCSMF